MFLCDHTFKKRERRFPVFVKLVPDRVYTDRIANGTFRQHLYVIAQMLQSIRVLLTFRSEWYVRWHRIENGW